MFEYPSNVNMDFGTINSALAFLAGYDIYVCTSTDRFVGIMSDAHATIYRVKGLDSSTQPSSARHSYTVKWINMQTPYESRLPIYKNSEYHKTNTPKIWHRHYAFQWTIHLPKPHMQTLLKQPSQKAELLCITAIYFNVNTNHNCLKMKRLRLDHKSRMPNSQTSEY